jgi:hypothetical protein
VAGRENKKVYLYDTDGKYLRQFESISEFARTFQFSENLFSGENRRYNPDVYEFEDGRIAALYRIGRQGIRDFKRYDRSEYTKVYRGRKIAETVLKDSGKLKPVRVFNLDGELIAEFSNSYFCKKLMKLDKDFPLKHYTDEGVKFEFVN